LRELKNICPVIYILSGWHNCKQIILLLINDVITGIIMHHPEEPNWSLWQSGKICRSLK